MTERHGSTQPECDALVDYLFGELTSEQMASFAAHLKGCLRCQDELAGLQSVHTRLTEYSWDEELSGETGDGSALVNADAQDLGAEDKAAPVQWAALKEKTLQAAFAARAAQQGVQDSEVRIAPLEHADLGEGELRFSHLKASAQALGAPQNEDAGSALKAVPRSQNAFSGERRRSSLRSHKRLRAWFAFSAVAVVLGVWLVIQGSSGVHAFLDTPLRMEASSAFPQTGGMLMIKRDADMMQLTLALHKVPPAPSNGCYELWVVTPSGQHIGFGEFVPKANGQVTVTAMVPQSLTFVSVGVTREPQWGDKKPLGQMVVRMKMPESV